MAVQVTMDDVNANEFLTIKSTEQQKKEGVEHPVDTAFVEEHDGELVLKAVFDVHHFKSEEVTLKVGYNVVALLIFAFALGLCLYVVVLKSLCCIIIVVMTFCRCRNNSHVV